MAIVTWNPVGKGANNTLSNNNLTVYGTSGNWGDSSCKTTNGLNTGKYYWEIEINTVSDCVGISGESFNNTTAIFLASNAIGYLNSGQIVVNTTTVSTVNTYAENDTVGIALNLVDKQVSFYKNNILQYTVSNLDTNLTGNIYPTISVALGGTITANFGGSEFKYNIPSGYSTLTSISKFLIKQSSQYYTIKIDFYNDITHQFIPLTLNGGIIPDGQDIKDFGFDNVSLLTNNFTKNSDIIKPIDKFDNTAELKLYKPI